jgi:hypothetical protein
MDAIDTSYKTKGVTSRSVDMAGGKLLWDDFSTNGGNNLVYQLACEDQGAKYVELHYDAQCVTGINKTVSLFVRGQPRCYAKTCTDVDGQSLLAMFSLGPTENGPNMIAILPISGYVVDNSATLLGIFA